MNDREIAVRLLCAMLSNPARPPITDRDREHLVVVAVQMARKLLREVASPSR